MNMDYPADEELDIDLYADVDDAALTGELDQRDLFDDVVTGTSGHDHDDGEDLELTDKLHISETSSEEQEKMNNVLKMGRSMKMIHEPIASRSHRILVGNITWWTTDADLIGACKEVGVEDVTDIKVIENRANGQSKGYCHLSVSSPESVNTLLSKLANQMLNGNSIQVAPATKMAASEFESRSKSRPSAPAPQGQGGLLPHFPLNSYSRPPPSVRPPLNMPGEANNFHPGNSCPPRFLARVPTSGANYRNDSFCYPNNNFPRNSLMLRPPSGPPPPMIMQNGPNNPGMRPQGPPIQGPCYPRPEMFPRGPRGGLIPHGGNGQSQQPHNWIPNNRMPYYGPNVNLEHRVPGSTAPHVNPAFFNPGPPGVHSRDNSPGPQCGSPRIATLPPPPPFISDKSIPSGMNDVNSPGHSFNANPKDQDELESVLSRNRTVSSSAITRAVTDAASGDFGSAIETLVTAISLINSSAVSSDQRCRVIIHSLQSALHGIENRSYGRSSRRDRKSRSRERKSRSRDRESRSRDRRSRSRSRERHARRGYTTSSSSYTSHRDRRNSADQDREGRRGYTIYHERENHRTDRNRDTGFDNTY